MKTFTNHSITIMVNYYGDAYGTCLFDFSTAVKVPTGQFRADSIMGTSIYMARSVLEGTGYTYSSELESLMYVIAFLAADGAVHWGNKPVGSASLTIKVQNFIEQKKFEQ